MVEAFGIICKHYLAMGERCLGKRTSLQKLAALRVVARTTFTGGAFAEVALASFLLHVKEQVRRESGCQLHPRALQWGPARCMWGGIMKLAEVNPDDLSTEVHVPSSSSVVRENCEGCKLHGKNANCPGPHAADSRDIGSRDYSVDIATFPCPPFSRQGNMLGEKGPRFRPYVAMVVCIRKRRPTS